MLGFGSGMVGAMSTKTLHRLSPVVLALAAVKVLLQLVTTGIAGDGFFVDELYFLACAEHLDWGYVDLPPLFPALTAAVRAVAGDSLLAIRVVPAMAGAGLVVLAGWGARRLGGGSLAQTLAGLSVLCAPIWLVMHSLHTMNALEPLVWTGCALVLVTLLEGGDQRYWLLFGVLAGVGLNLKHSIVFWGVAVALGVLASRQRSMLTQRWIWLGGAVALALFLPNLIWMIGHGFPHLEQLANIRESGRNVSLSPLAFIGEQVLMLHPLTLPVWLGGLAWLLRTSGGVYRPLGIAYLVALAEMLVLGGRTYYLSPAYPILLAAGGVAVERSVVAWGWRRAGTVAVMALLSGSAAVMAPLYVPILAPEDSIAYSEALGMSQPRIENHELGPLPQLMADRYGWREMAEEVARVYHTLPEDDRRVAAIFGQNYGQAGAIDLYRDELDLPPALSGHLTYFLWGPRGYSGEVVIVLDDDRDSLETLFESVELAGRVDHRWSMPYQHFDIYVCRGIRAPLEEVWPRTKSYS